VPSTEGNNAVIQLVPEPPINLANDPLTTTDIVIRFTWDEGLNNGGVPVLDYDVYYDQGSQVGSFILLEEAVLTKYYQTTITLTPGETYSFKVTSRNTVGDSDLSDAIAILAAKPPDAPLNLAEVPGLTTAYQVGLLWNDGVYDGASPVIDY
jgi:hypothetical protein